ncbi:MAG TPA: pitrilysin family protein [Candidatus Eremiobacteraceae bacterium]
MNLRPVSIVAALGFTLSLTYAPGAALAETGVTRATLANGLRVIVVQNSLAPVVTVMDNYLVGADETPAGFPGMAHAQEHMAFRGCAGVTADQTAAIFAQLGGDGDADTQQNITQYFETVPAQDLDVALELDSSCMRDIVDAQDQWKEESGPIQQEVAQDLSNPIYKFLTRLNADMFAGTPYAHDALGTRPSFNATTGTLLKRFFRQWYGPNNAILVIAGDVDPQRTLATVRSMYGDIPMRATPARPVVALSPVKSDTFDLDSDLAVKLSVISYRFPGTSSADYAAARILSDVLGSQRADIYALGPTGKALNAGFQMFESYPKASIGAAVAVLAPNADARPIDDEIRAIIAQYVKYGVPPELVDAAKRSEIASAEFNRTAIDGLAGAWSQAVAAEGRQSPDEGVSALTRVSVADVDRAARTYLQGAMVTANLNPKPSGAATAESGFGGKEINTVAPTKPVVIPDWAKNALSSLAVPPSTLHPYDTTLPNGIRLIVQRETVSSTVSIVGEVRQEPALQVPAGKEGVDQVLGGLFQYGTTSLDRLAFQKALDDIAAQESAGPSFTLNVLTQHFDRGVQLLADNELHPALPASAFTIARDQTAQAVAGELNSPAYKQARAIDSALLPPDDPALRQASPASIGALSLDDVKMYDAAAFRPDMTTIVVIGDVTPAQAETSVAKWFGGWSAVGAKPNIVLPAVPLNKPSAAVVPDASRVQDSATLVENIAVAQSDPDYYALRVGNHVLGGGFYATRLYHDLREKAGLVYFVDNNFAVGKTRSTFSVDFACDPPKVSQAQAIIIRDLRAMQTDPVTPAELQQAKALLLRQIPLAESSEDAVANGLIARVRDDLPLDEPTRAAHNYLAITAAQIQAAFAKWIRLDGFVQVVLGPQPH